MRTYGRVTDENGVQTWQVVSTDANGYNDAVYVTTLAQCLKLNLGESPFFANYGLPAHESIVTQVYPDFYIARTQQQFAPFFASLLITRMPTVNVPGSVRAAAPTYRANIVTHAGAKLPTIRIPTLIPA